MKLENELSVDLPRVIPRKLIEAIADELNMMLSKELNKSLSKQSIKNLPIDLLEKLQEFNELSESIAFLSQIHNFSKETPIETSHAFQKKFEKEQHENFGNESLEEPYVFVLPYNLDDSPDEQTLDAYSEEETLDEYSDDYLDESTDEYLDSLIEKYSDESMDELGLQWNEGLGITDDDNKDRQPYLR